MLNEINSKKKKRITEIKAYKLNFNLKTHTLIHKNKIKIVINMHFVSNNAIFYACI